MNSAILALLAAGDMTRAQIANELKRHPPAVGGALVTLINSGQVIISGKVHVERKPVTLYSLPNGQVVPKQQPVKQASQPAKLRLSAGTEMLNLSDSNLYQIWGGYASVDKDASNGLAVRRHTES